MARHNLPISSLKILHRLVSHIMVQRALILSQALRSGIGIMSRSNGFVILFDPVGDFLIPALPLEDPMDIATLGLGLQ